MLRCAQTDKAEKACGAVYERCALWFSRTAEKESAVKNLWNFMRHLQSKGRKQEQSKTNVRQIMEARARRHRALTQPQLGRDREFDEAWSPHETDYRGIEHPTDREHAWEWELWRVW
jgi:hypothetical protein